MNSKIKQCQNCINCAFLCQLRYSVYSELDDAKRKEIKSANTTTITKVQGCSVIGTNRLACYKAQLPTGQRHNPWSQGPITKPVQDLNKTKCEFYMPYVGCEGLELSAIEQKHRRNVEKENSITAIRALKIARIGVVISALAVTISVISWLFK